MKPNAPAGWQKVGQVEPKAGRYNRRCLTSTAKAAAATANQQALDAAYIVATAAGYTICRLRDIAPGQRAVRVSPWGDVYKQQEA